jgi:Fe-S-cluster containining protein
MTVDKRPEDWDASMLESNWLEHLRSLSKKGKSAMPFQRVRYQAEEETHFLDMLPQWSEMNAEQRKSTWEQLISNSEQSTTEVMPVCVRCGTCCKEGSPALYEDDLELLRDERIPWERLYTLRKGEPARSPYTGEIFYLPEELIKIRENAESSQCSLFGQSDSSCTIYDERPVQCRAQACWDRSDLHEQAKSEHLTRRDIFKRVDTILTLLDEHDRRCSFEQLRNAFEELKESQGKNVDGVIEILAFDDHFRDFLVEKLNLPRNTLDLVCGRPLADRVRLFGFRVESASDGSRTLVADE